MRRGASVLLAVVGLVPPSVVAATSQSSSVVGVDAQMVIVEVASPSATSGTLRVVESIDGVERVVVGPVVARLGRNGVKRNRREGDGTTPLGTMKISGSFGLARSAVTALPYRRVVQGDCWISDVAESSYNQRVRRSDCAAPNEDLHRIAESGPYEFALTTDYNTSPIEAGKGSAIFIHVHSYDNAGRTRPTSGCVSVSRTVLKRLFALLDLAKNPRLVVRIKR